VVEVVELLALTVKPVAAAVLGAIRATAVPVL
jgi:hypothetical protein